MKLIAAFFLVSVQCQILPVFAQSEKDNLLKKIEEIRQMPLDTAQVNKLRKLSSAADLIDTGLSRQLLGEALVKSLKVGEINTITDCYRILGVWFSSFDQKDSALRYYRLSAQSAKSNNNLYLLAGADFNIGNIFYWQGKYDSCIVYYQRAASVFEDPALLKDKSVTEKMVDRRKSDLYGNMSSVFNTLKNITKADEYIDKAIGISKKYNSPAAADALAFYMQTKADNYHESGLTEKALRTRLYFLPQMEHGLNAKIYLHQAYQNISQEYFILDKLDSSQSFALQSLAIANAIQVPNAIAAANWQLGRISMHHKDYGKAASYLSKTKEHYESTSDPVEQQSYFNVMRELSYSTGKYKEAYEYFEKYKAINDSLLLSEKTKEFAEREMRYETEKKENQIQLQQSQLQQKNIINYVFIGSSVSLAIILLLTYRNYKNRQQLHRQRIHELETEKQLSATQYLLKGQEDERNRLAKDLHDGLGGLLSGVKLQLGAMKGNLILSAENAMAFDRALNKLDESIGEMRRVAHNMMPEALIKLGLQQAVQDYCDGLQHQQSFVINCEMHGVEGRMENAVEIVLYRIVQELLNNVVKHANATTILVQMMKQEDGHLTITVEDNGNGFDLGKADIMLSAGIRNIQSRVNYLNGSLNIKSSPGKGTSVYIECETGKEEQ